MEEFAIQKIYIDSRYQVKNGKYHNNADFEVILPQVVSLPEKCHGFVDEIILPVLFVNVQTGVNDKLYLKVFYNGVDHFYTYTFPESNYTLDQFYSKLQEFLFWTNEADKVGFTVTLIESVYQISIVLKDQRITKPDVCKFSIFTDEELVTGAYNNTIISDPNSVNNILQNYKFESSIYDDISVIFDIDLHPVRNLYLTCSELTSYGSLTNFLWEGRAIIKKIPVNVPFGSLLFHYQQTQTDVFKCGNKTLSRLRFQLRNAEGDIIKLNNHWSFTLLFYRGNE